ncbi:MAG: 1-acyl-sn-glycerol-3-phosphate acyltransferase [Proteobacteria bacterium]|nr:1-acyl-sn-glycerol-3-phosphate acyltransferase [Pseudomonadota bacterium]MBU4472071.1 1-acyl-sn-glycerol-3-phosphate acyltransferase [Pseudomonadota bacterium]MCG2752931.1 1-acyl-sn-glycerol-3-phosphate acyltransferase [Desulfobacteraceae bacterium]
MPIQNVFEHKITGKYAKIPILVFINIFGLSGLILWTLTGFLLFPIGLVYMKFIQGYSVLLLTRKCIWIYGRVWQFIFSAFVVFQKIDFDPYKFSHPGIIVANHRSFFDTYCMNMLPVYDICFGVRAWPFKMIFYRLFMELAGYINIEKFPWRTISRIAKKNFADKSYVMIFPEGHRSRNKAMTKFYSGAFKLSIENNVPLIPVCLTGTEKLLPAGRMFLAPAKIKMKILDPVWPDQFQGVARHILLKKHVKNLMDAHIREMDAE